MGTQMNNNKARTDPPVGPRFKAPR
uniref:Uncharacterized protein n=1 Tax=Anguilla anguilla TaxID=7936 RepID=A0A0E9PVP4_ANGAN